MSTELDIRSDKVLAAVVWYLLHKGVSPTYSEIMELSGIPSKGTIKLMIDELEAANLIRRVGEHQRHTRLAIVGVDITIPENVLQIVDPVMPAPPISSS